MPRHRLRFLAFAMALVLLGPAPILAQSTYNAAPQAGGITLPGTSGQACVQVNVKGEKPSAYNCLNQQLQQEVEGAGHAEPGAPLTATSPSNEVGTFNRQGVSEQYGQNFGKSVIPYRPPPPVFSSGLGH